MPKFFAQTSRGLEEALFEEMAELGFDSLARISGGVEFVGSWSECYRANLVLRVASRVMLPILDFPAYQPEDIYHNIQKHDFTKYIDPHGTLSVDSQVRDSMLKDNRFVALKTKDAIVDQFRDKYEVRPNVSKDNPQLNLFVRVVKNEASVAINTSGETLSKRGYREESGFAPMREHLAAGLLRIAGWKPGIPLVDPMCGSGTFVIEAAMQARQMAPGTFRKKFGFQNWKTFQPDTFSKLIDEVSSLEKDETDSYLVASDRDKRAVEKARRNAKRADVDDQILWLTKAIDMLKPPEVEEPGILVVNPPYGERLGITEELKDVYRDMGFAFKQYFKGWKCWVLSGNPELTEHLRLKASRRVPVYNGQLECRFLCYEIR